MLRQKERVGKGRDAQVKKCVTISLCADFMVLSDKVALGASKKPFAVTLIEIFI